MKKSIGILGVLFVFVVFLTACGNQQSNSNQNSSTNSTKKLELKKNTFVNVKAQKSTKNGFYNIKTKIHFVDEKHYIEVSTAKRSDYEKHWIREVQIGNYSTKGSKKVELKNSKNAIQEEYKSKADLNEDAAPIKYEIFKGNLTRPVSQSSVLTKTKYKLTRNGAKYKKTTAPKIKYSNFDSYIKRQTNRSNAKYATLANKSFSSPATDALENTIGFKQNKFIWKYGGMDTQNNAGSEPVQYLSYLTGTYAVVDDTVQLFLDSGNSIFKGSITDLANNTYLDKYTTTAEIVTFQLVGNKEMKLSNSDDEHINSQNMVKSSSNDGNLTYEKFANAMRNTNGVPFGSNMTKVDESTRVKSKVGNNDSETSDDSNDEADTEDDNVVQTIQSAEDFKQALFDNGVLDTSLDYNVQNGNGYEFPILDGSEDTETVQAKYQVSWDVNDGAITHIIILGNDGKVYQGNSGSLLSEAPDITSEIS